MQSAFLSWKKQLSPFTSTICFAVHSPHVHECLYTDGTRQYVCLLVSCRPRLHQDTFSFPFPFPPQTSWKGEYWEQSMQKAIINKNAMTRPIVIVTAARVVLKIRRISAVFTSVNIFEQQIDHIGKYNSPHWKYESRKSGSDTSNDQKFSIIPRQKSCTDLIICFLFHQPLRAFVFAELVASYHQLSPFSQVEV